MTTLPPPSTLLTPDEAAAYLRLKRAALRRLIQRGEIATIKVGPRLRISADELARYTGVSAPLGW